MARRPPEIPKTFEAKVKAFIKLLGSGAHEKNEREKFRDWCEAAYCAYAKLSALWFGDSERANELETRYMKVVNSYVDKDFIRRAWVEMRELGEDAMEQGGGDFLGVIAGQLNALDSDQGQFFTPFPVSRMMADIQLGDMGEYIRQNGYFTLGEPAVGSGGLVIAAADAMSQQGFNPMLHLLVQAWDVNYLAYTMCYLQLTWRGVPALCVRGDTLRMDVFEQAWTPLITIFSGHHGVLPQYAFDRREAADHPAEDAPARTIESVIETEIERNLAVAQPEQPEMPPEAERDSKPVQLSLF